MDKENLYPNQKTVTVNKEQTYGKIFASVHLDNIDHALAVLSPNTFKLWTFFAKNSNGYEFALYRTNVMKCCKFGASTYTKSIQELVNLKYLIPTKDGRGYDFYDTPQETGDILVKIHKQEDSSNDEFLKSLSENLDRKTTIHG